MINLKLGLFSIFFVKFRIFIKDSPSIHMIWNMCVRLYPFDGISYVSMQNGIKPERSSEMHVELTVAPSLTGD